MKYATEDDIHIARQALEASQRESFPYNVEIGGLDLVVHEGVFSPKYLKSSRVFIESLPFTPGMRFLEIGCGIGTLAIAAAAKGAEQVLATDINPRAVANAAHNAARLGFAERVETRVSDIYSDVRADERFDLIFWNSPFMLLEPTATTSMLERGVFDPGYRAIGRFIREGKGFLRPGGDLMLGFGSTLGDLSQIEAIAREVGARVDVVHRTKNFVSQSPMDIELLAIR